MVLCYVFDMLCTLPAHQQCTYAGEADDAGFGDALVRVRQHLAGAAARSAACLVRLRP